jgi:3-oxoadipate enol-lactonase
METLTITKTGYDLNISIDGLTICYDDLGTGDLPIIFIHGFPFDKSSWLPQMEFLKNNHRVIAFDLRGFGKSTARESEESISLFADDLIKFMDELEISKAIVCGLSMGGYILLNAVSRYPERFEAIILSDTQCNADSSKGNDKRNMAIEEIKLNGLANFAVGTVSSVFCSDTLKNRKDFVESIRNLILSSSPLEICKTLRALARREDVCEILNKLYLPTLIICGKEDVVTPPDQSIFLYCNIVKSRLHFIENAGHMSNLEQPDQFNQLISNFISALPKW